MTASSPGDAQLAAILDGGVEALGCPLSAVQRDQLVAYVRLLARWNKTYNLTAIRDPSAMATHHLLDCLAAAAALARHRAPAELGRILDVGTCAGLPGIVLAIALPQSNVVCIDKVAKKTAFVVQALASLGIRNAAVVDGRVETLTADPFDIIVSRAFASLADFIACSRHLLAQNGEWMAMKGKPPYAEAETLPGISASIQPLTVPGLAAERSIVWMRPATTVCAS